jgi:hypothetical protein
MNRHNTGILLAAFAASALSFLGSATASAYDHIDAALEFTQLATTNDWGTPCSINWSTPSGTTKASCFFTLSLSHARSYTSDEISALWNSTSPTSAAYFTIIDSSPTLGSLSPAKETYFRKITTATAIQRGDILVIGATDTYTGHMAMITGPLTEITPQVMPRYSGTKQWAVPIADSANVSHGCNAAYPDSRWRGPCTGGFMDPGAGTATMRIYTDSLTGVLLGYTWSVTASSSSYYSPSTRPYRVGRPFKLPPHAEPPPPPP